MTNKKKVSNKNQNYILYTIHCSINMEFNYFLECRDNTFVPPNNCSLMTKLYSHAPFLPKCHVFDKMSFLTTLITRCHKLFLCNKLIIFRHIVIRYHTRVPPSAGPRIIIPYTHHTVNIWFDTYKP